VRREHALQPGVGGDDRSAWITLAPEVLERELQDVVEGLGELRLLAWAVRAPLPDARPPEARGADDDERDEDEDRERPDDAPAGVRSAFGTSLLTTSLTSFGISFSRNDCMRSSWRRCSFASFTVSLSPSSSAKASIVL
jgi:hypothetical protein